MALRERGDGARQTRGRREEGREVAVRMTCVGGVREHDETRKCEGNNTMREGKLAVGVVAVLQGLYRTKHGISRYQAASPPRHTYEPRIITLGICLISRGVSERIRPRDHPAYKYSSSPLVGQRWPSRHCLAP